MVDEPTIPAAKTDSVARPTPATPVAARSAAEEIEVWFKDNFLGTALTATTELYNLARAAKEDLKTRLKI